MMCYIESCYRLCRYPKSLPVFSDPNFYGKILLNNYCFCSLSVWVCCAFIVLSLYKFLSIVDFRTAYKDCKYLSGDMLK